MTNEEAERLEALDRACVWHPFTPMLEYTSGRPLVIAEGLGCVLTDVRGNRYLDGVSSLWVNVHGHRHPVIDQAVRDQLDRVAHSTLLGLANVPAAELAGRLVETAPGNMPRVFYSDNGSTATEVALKMAFQARAARRGRPLFFRFTNAYHGDTLGSVSVGGIELFHSTFRQLTFETATITAPYCYRCPFGSRLPDCTKACFEELDRAFAEQGDQCAAAIVEPVVQGAAGIIIQPEGYLAHLQALCRQHDVLLIADEVATGFGRTGRMFACEHEGVEPDLLAVAKGITGGYLPLAATLTSDPVYEAFLNADPEQGTFFHGHTYTGNPLACAAAGATLDLFETENTLEQLGRKIPVFTRELSRLAALDHVGEVRQKGFMVGVELVADRDSRTPYPPKERRGVQVILEARRRGVLLRPLGDVVVLMPPLCMSEKELITLVDATEEAIRVVTEG